MHDDDIMRSRFTRWALLTIFLLLGSSAIGLVVRGVIKPKKYEHNYNFRPTVTTNTVPTTVPTRDELQPVPQTFQKTRPPTTNEATDFTAVLQRIQSDCSSYKSETTPEWQVLQHFFTNRMAQEWVRFGVYKFRGKSISDGDINMDESRIQQAIPQRVAYNSSAFRPSKIEIVRIAVSDNRVDRAVLAKHTSTVNDARTTWYCRWWFSSQYGSWKLYDFEEQPSRLRFTAILASRQLAYYGETADSKDPKKSLAAVDALVDTVGAMMTTGNWQDQPADHAVQNQLFPVVLTAMRCALREPEDDQTEIQKLKEALAIWPDSATIHLMIASRNKDLNSIATYRSLAGGQPWADALEASILLERGDRGNARKLLDVALAANTGNMLLIEALYDVLPSVERAEVGTQAARSVSPSMAIRRIVQRHIQDKEIDSVVQAYLVIRPGDSAAIVAQAVLQAAAGNTKAAKTTLQAAMNEAGADSSDLVKWFVTLLSKRSGQTREDILKNPDLGSLLK